MESHPYFKVFPVDTGMDLVEFRGLGPDTVNPDASTLIKEVTGEVEVLFNGETHELNVNRRCLLVPPNTPHTLHAIGEAVVTISLRHPKKP